LYTWIDSQFLLLIFYKIQVTSFQDLATNVSAIFSPLDATLRPITLHALRVPSKMSSGAQQPHKASTSSTSDGLIAVCCVAHQEPRLEQILVFSRFFKYLKPVFIKDADLLPFQRNQQPKPSATGHRWHAG